MEDSCDFYCSPNVYVIAISVIFWQLPCFSIRPARFSLSSIMAPMSYEEIQCVGTV